MYAAATMIAASLVLGSMSTSLNSASKFLAMLCMLPRVEDEIVVFAGRSTSSVMIVRRIVG
jgi:hypothetical protein